MVILEKSNFNGLIAERRIVEGLEIGGLIAQTEVF